MLSHAGQSAASCRLAMPSGKRQLTGPLGKSAGTYKTGWLPHPLICPIIPQSLSHVRAMV
eukprot:6835211-Karenia_brevis.AAC.1